MAYAAAAAPSFLASDFEMPTPESVAVPVSLVSASRMRSLNVAIAKAVGFRVEGVSFRVNLKFGKPLSVLASVLEKSHKGTKMGENGHRSTRRRRTAGGIADL